MARIGILNMVIGFLIIFLAACGGAFNAFDMTVGFMKNPALLESWQMVLLNSAHGHANLFGYIHILFGLTLPYSGVGDKVKKIQTAGIFAGAIAMGPLLMARAFAGPSESLDPLGIMIGIFLSAALICIAWHMGGLSMKLFKRA